MKKCPECDETFGDHQNFCDVDGSPLLDDIAVLQTALQNFVPEETIAEGSPSQFSWSTAIIGILIGIILCLIALTFRSSIFPDSRDTNRKSSASERPSRPVFSQVASTQPRELAPAPVTEAISDEEEAQPDPSPSVEAPRTERAPPSLNNGPVSTGAKREGEQGKTLIKLKDGSAVTADAAWEDGQGVWFRRGGLVSFVERNQVEAISDIAQPKEPSEANPTP